MKQEELLRERLKRYSASGTAAFHMPGHKRQMECGLLRDFPNPFSIDITEIDGFDNLHHPEGILKDSMELRNFKRHRCSDASWRNTAGEPQLS